MHLQIRNLIVMCCTGLLLTSCADKNRIFGNTSYDPIDRQMNLSRGDFRNMASPKEASTKDNENIIIKAETLAPPIPKLAPILAAPKPPQIGNARLVSIAVTDDIPLKDVLIELARLADVDVEIDSGIKGGISFRASNRPFNEVINRMANLAGLRYKMKDGVLRIERDLPYVRNYDLDFLNIIRSSSSKVSISTDVMSLSGSTSGDSGGNSGLSTGSSSSIEAKAEDDFWRSLEKALKAIISDTPKTMTSAKNDESTANNKSNTTTPPASTTTENSDTTAQAGSTDSNGETGNKLANGSFFVINRQAGILSVSATDYQHKSIEAYLKHISANYSAQVLIEAKIVEVSLDEEFKSGVNWGALKGNSIFDVKYGPEIAANNVNKITLKDGNLGIGLNGVVSMMEKFGTTHTLSSPRLHAINNQQAVLTFAENKIFFEVKVEQQDDQVVNGIVIPGKITVDSTRRSVPIGIILNIQPSINLRDNEVTLSVRPTLSRQVSSVTDPGSAIVNQILKKNNPDAETFTNEVPIVEVRELDSILKIKSGEVMVIGGLMEQVANNNDTGVPYMSDIPWFGNLFKGVNKLNKTKELIIFIRATIIGTNGYEHKTDRIIYNKFTKDPRPLSF